MTIASSSEKLVHDGIGEPSTVDANQCGRGEAIVSAMSCRFSAELRR